MGCLDIDLDSSPAYAYRLLIKAAMAIPTWHYLVALVIFCFGILYNFLEFHFLEDLFSGFRGSPVLLTYNSSSELYEKVVSKCQTLHNRQIFNASDGGRFALDWLRSSDVTLNMTPKNTSISKDDTTPIVIVIPGLSSDSSCTYIKHLAFSTANCGWDVVITNHRGLGGISVTSDCLFNAGWTEDIRAVVEHLHQKYPLAPLFILGTSIGANILVKYLGEEGKNAPIAGAVAICSPWDLLIASRFIHRRLIQKLYDRALAVSLLDYAQLHRAHYSHLANWEGIEKARTIRDFDTHATCLVGKYETVDTYYRQCSSSPFVGRVSVPLLCIGALDDPLCTVEAIPWDECRANRNIVLAMTKHGGHLAFCEGIAASHLWWVRAVNEFLGVLHNSSLMHKRKTHSPICHSELMESAVDQGPYRNVADGLVAATGAEPLADNGANESCERQRNHVQTLGMVSDQSELAREAKHEHNPNILQTLERDANSKDSKSVSANMVTRWLSQLSQQNKRSMWLLAYIAILSTWPLVGTALNFLYRKKFKKILPAQKHK